MSLRILTEASGSLVSGYLIKAIQEAGHVAVASDVDEACVGRYLADDFVRMPFSSDPGLWQYVEDVVREKQIDLVIPSFDETLVGWSERRERFSGMGVDVVVSEPEVIHTFIDKWSTYCFLRDSGIVTPRTSLAQEYPLVKPRYGRGGKGVSIPAGAVAMEGMVSQEVATGEEYTVDVFCNHDSHPVYIVPRKRIAVRDGKSTQGVVVSHPGIVEVVTRLCGATRFIGPVNIQCFVDDAGRVNVIEVNPRIAGGMALGFAATENWIRLICDNLLAGTAVRPKPVQYGLRMIRYYAELFVPGN